MDESKDIAIMLNQVKHFKNCNRVYSTWVLSVKMFSSALKSPICDHLAQSPF